MAHKYELLYKIRYYSPRYGKHVTMQKGYRSDGASGAIDLDGPVICRKLADDTIVMKSLSWWVHDKLCDRMMWDDGTPVSNRQASMVLRDILRSEGHWIRDYWWFLTTWIYRMVKTGRA